MIPAVIERCAGIDVGKKFLAVCVMRGPANEEAEAEIASLGPSAMNWRHCARGCSQKAARMS